VFDLILVYFAGHKMSNLDPKAKPAEEPLMFRSDQNCFTIQNLSDLQQ